MIVTGCLSVSLWTVAVPLGVLKDTDGIINSSDRSAAETSFEFKPFISHVTVIDKTNTSMCMAE